MDAQRPELISRLEIAELCGINERTVRDWTTKGFIHPVPAGRGRVLYQRVEVARVLGERGMPVPVGLFGPVVAVVGVDEAATKRLRHALGPHVEVAIPADALDLLIAVPKSPPHVVVLGEGAVHVDVALRLLRGTSKPMALIVVGGDAKLRANPVDACVEFVEDPPAARWRRPPGAQGCYRPTAASSSSETSWRG